MTREEAIQQIFDKHGAAAVYIFSTGYISRTAAKLCPKGYTAFYMQGSMGLAPAVGVGRANAVSEHKQVVVVNGDASLLMSLGTTHTVRDYMNKRLNLFHYVLDNGCHESVGGQPCAKLERSYPGVVSIVKIDRGKADGRVAISPADNAHKVREFCK